MVKRSIAGFCSTLLLATAFGACADEGLVGVWKLVSYTASDADSGSVIQPFGEHPNGYIIYTAGGRMSALLAADGRARFSGGNRVTAPASERAEAFSTSSAYGGTYTFAGDRVIHHVDIAVNPDWVGTDQVRYSQLEGKRLTLTTPPLPTRPDGHLRVSTLVWEKTE